MTAPTIPTGTREDVLADLRRRRDVAEALMREAQASGDDAGFNAAYERFVLRLKQIDWVENRPDGALCPNCVFGEEGWPPDFHTKGQPYSCLEHWTPFLARQAEEQARIEREGRAA